MKRMVTWAAWGCAAYFVYIALSLVLLPPVAELKNRKESRAIQVRDWEGNYHPLIVGPKNRNWVNSGSIPAEMKWAVILAEDANFYKHEGVDVKALKNAIKHDLEKKSFARGASTITQQTAKNLYLSREKTLTRKFKELYLALRMEQELTKGRIVELYLNLVELGPMVHGIGHGAKYYFGKSAAQLTPRECAFLAAMLPGPRLAYNPYRNLDKVLRRSDMILKLLRNKGVLSEAEYQVALAEIPNINRMQKKIDTSISQPIPVFNLLSSQSAPIQPPNPEAKSNSGTDAVMPGNGPAGHPVKPGDLDDPPAGAEQKKDL